KFLHLDDDKLLFLQNKSIDGYIEDISATGLKFISLYNIPLKPNNKIRVEFTLNDKPFVFIASIIRKEESVLSKEIIYGLQFKELMIKEQDELTSELFKIEAQRRASEL